MIRKGKTKEERKDKIKNSMIEKDAEDTELWHIEYKVK